MGSRSHRAGLSNSSQVNRLLGLPSCLSPAYNQHVAWKDARPTVQLHLLPSTT